MSPHPLAQPAGFLPPAIFVFGGAPEITPEIAATRVVHLPLRGVPDSAAGAVVFDLRECPMRDLAAVRARATVAPLPLLLVAGSEIPESAFQILRADDGIVVTSCGDSALRRRVALLRGLASARAESDTLQQLLVARQRFDQSILDGVEVGVVTADDFGIVTFVNRTAATLLHLGEVAAPPVQRLLGLPRHPQELLGNDALRSLAYSLAVEDGVTLDLELSLSRGEADGGFFFIFRDVHQEKQREAERRRFERLAAMGTMVAGFAHEVRNPVAAMRSLVEELDEELGEGAATAPHVRLILQMIERIERLVRTSLQFGRPATPRRAPQRPALIVASAIAELRPRLRALGDELCVEADGDLPDVDVDERQLAQALVVLLQNALDATGSASRVLMRVRSNRLPERLSDAQHEQLFLQAQSRARPGDAPADPTARRARRSSIPPYIPSVRFEVVDDGPGVPQNLLGCIFDPFFTTKASGTGLGLAIAQQIVGENGARLEVSSTPGGPTIFSIVVPCGSLAGDPAPFP